MLQFITDIYKKLLMQMCKDFSMGVGGISQNWLMGFGHPHIYTYTRIHVAVKMRRPFN